MAQGATAARRPSLRPTLTLEDEMEAGPSYGGQTATFSYRADATGAAEERKPRVRAALTKPFPS
jgi:hypothetical protein